MCGVPYSLCDFACFFSDCPQDHMTFKTISIPIMGMEGADESWKTYFHTSNAKTGCLIGPPTKGVFFFFSSSF